MQLTSTKTMSNCCFVPCNAGKVISNGTVLSLVGKDAAGCLVSSDTLPSSILNNCTLSTAIPNGTIVGNVVIGVNTGNCLVKQAVTLLTLTSSVPLPDGVTDTRTGQVGTSTQAARADHIHPIQRIATIPALPAVTVGGQTLNSSNGTFRYSTEETISYQIQVTVTPTTVGTWKTINFPAIAGYILTEINYNGTYRPSLVNASNDSQNFIWAGTTFYHSARPNEVNQQLTHNFTLTYLLS